MEPFAANGSSSRAADGVKRPTEIAEIATVAAVAAGAPYLLTPPRKVDNRIVVRRRGGGGAAVEEEADEAEEQEGGGGGRGGGGGGRSGSRWQLELAYPHVLDYVAACARISSERERERERGSTCSHIRMCWILGRSYILCVLILLHRCHLIMPWIYVSRHALYA